MNIAERIAFETLMEPVATRLLGEPNSRLSKPPRDVRYGTHGSMSVNMEDGKFYDHEKDVGGGVLDLIMHVRAAGDRTAAVSWMRSNGLLNQTRNNVPSGHARPRFVCTYGYTDEHGALLYETVRYEPKTFRQRRPGARHGEWVWNLDGVRRILYRLAEVVSAVASNRTIHVVEGEGDAETLRRLGLIATTNPMGAGKLRPEYSEALRSADVVIIGDHDEAGRNHVEQVAAALHGIAKCVRVLDLAKHWPQCPNKGDISDWIAAGGSAEKLAAMVDAEPEWKPRSQETSGPDGWPEPKRLPDGLLPVEPFESEFMPASFAPWVDDIANRLQCPPDYVAVTAMTALGAVIGRRIGISPQTKTDWVEIPNVWGAFIGRPGMLKSPAMGEALKPIHRLEGEAAKDNEIARQAYAAGLDAFKLRKQVNAALMKEELKKSKDGKAKDISFDVGEEPKEPAPVRYRTNDSSYESLGELLIGNPAGILVERDELVSLLKHLDHEDQTVARGFYLSGWSGTQPYTFDRIGRGHRHVEAVCVSVLGNTQPARICEYVRRANAGGAGGDGLLQRFGLLVWPDAPANWRNVDEYPDGRARDSAWKVFERLSKMDEAEAIRIGALKGEYDRTPYLRFDEEAGAEFLAWRTDLESRLRSGGLSPALEGHLAKYRKLVPALALMNHLADSGQGAVLHQALLKALAFTGYLESHARRLYAAGSEGERAAARAILDKIRGNELKDGFTARDIHRKDWAHLTERADIRAGLELLVDLDHIAASTPVSSERGGRPKVTYTINPRTLA
jgi:5S rRNA maturation endonuclease (ribonuclease M5)